MEKLVKTARVLDVFLKIAAVFTLVIAIILVVFDLLLLTFSACGTLGVEDGVIIGATVGGARLTLASGVEGDVYEFVKTYTMMSVSAVVMLIIAYIGIRMFRKILVPMKEGAPFAEGISREVWRFGIFTLIAGIAGSIVQFALSFAVGAMFDALSESGSLTVDTEYYGIDGGFILIAAIVLMLSYIFKYGEELQKQSDETL